MVEAMDDGDFYEKDAAEYCNDVAKVLRDDCNENSYFLNNGKIRKRTKREQKECLKSVEFAIQNMYTCIPRCSDLKKIGMAFTCWDEISGGGIGWN